MNFEKADKNWERYGKQRSIELIEFLEKFSDSGISVARVTDWKTHYGNAGTCCSTLGRVAARNKMTHIRTFMRNGEPYLVNDLVED